MKLIILLLFITTNLFSQSVIKLEQKAYRYEFKKVGEITVTTRHETVPYPGLENEIDSEYLSSGWGIKTYSDIVLSKLVSDSINQEFNKKRSVSEKEVNKLTDRYVDQLTGDTMDHMLYTIVRDTCSICMNSIIDELTQDTSFVKLVRSDDVKYVIVNYFQYYGVNKYDVIFITLRRRYFKSEFFYILYDK